MKILFITGLYPNESESYYASVIKRGSLATPSNVYQWGVVRGLIENGVDLEVCSFPFLPTYPKGVCIKRTKYEDIIFGTQRIGRSYSYSTIAGLKELDINRKLKKIIINWSKNVVPSEGGIILIYSLYGPFIETAINSAQSFNYIKVCPIVTDLFISSLSDLKKYPFLKKIQGLFEYKRIRYGIENADTFVLLAKGMERYVPKAVSNHVIIEGIASDIYPEPAKKNSKDIKILLYTGSLGVQTSVKELVDAFLMTRDPSFRLVICGSGSYSDYITEKLSEDKRIIFKGRVTREEAVRLQSEATVLINPRLPSVPDTPYSFPSKTIEYLVSGTPMIGYKLVGISEDYYRHFYIPEDNSLEALSKLITEVLNLSQTELDNKAFESWKFIINHKNAQSQLRKLVEHLTLMLK